MSNRELFYRLYGGVRVVLNKLLRRKKESKCRFVYIYTLSDFMSLKDKIKTINGSQFCEEKVRQEDCFCGENITFDSTISTNKRKDYQIEDGLSPKQQWQRCIEKAKIQPGWKNAGLYYTAFTKETENWCLSNWIWTSAAIGRVLCTINVTEGLKVANAFIEQQTKNGGWIVRYDIIGGELVRIEAPNDSAYIANNSLVSAYRATGDKKYLVSAQRCAKWIMDTALDSGLVPFGYDVDKCEWIRDHNIVDIGFTAGLFCSLYRETNDYKYLEFAKSFIKAYIEAYYDNEAGLFSTYIGSKGERLGGFFSRGQAWALEGLIPLYEITKDEVLFDIIERQINVIVKNQLKNGGWPCNFQGIRRLMGEDCKGIACIAKSIGLWANYSNNPYVLRECVKSAYNWCLLHTDNKSGMILSYSTDGAIEHSPNSSTGMLYANAYAIEVSNMINY